MPNQQLWPNTYGPGYGDILTTPGSPATTVTGLQTFPVSNFAPQSGQILTFVQGEWTPEAPQGSFGPQGPQGFQGPSGSSTTFSGNGSFMLGPGIRNPLFFETTFSGVNTTVVNGARTANRVVLYLFQLDVAITISKISVIATNNTLGLTMSVGIYSYTGTKLVDSGTFVAQTSPTVQTKTITPVTLSPGVYWQAQSATTNDSGATLYGIVAGGSFNILPAYVANSTRVGYAANPMVGGVLPSTLGAITAFTPISADGDGFVTPIYE
jgi:hypothetical protein